jgi:hypothetical protein
VTPLQGLLATMAAMSLGVCAYIVRELWIVRRHFPLGSNGTLSFVLGAWTYANVALYTVLSIANLVTAQSVRLPYSVKDWTEVLVIVSTFFCVNVVGRGLFRLTRGLELEQGGS